MKILEIIKEMFLRIKTMALLSRQTAENIVLKKDKNKYYNIETNKYED